MFIDRSQENARLKFVNPNNNTEYRWAVIKDIENNGGSITSSSAGKGSLLCQLV